MTPAGWLLLAAIAPVAVIIAVYPVGALLFIIAIVPPARTTPDTPLRAALKPAIFESSRRAAVTATVRWIRAYTTTSHGWRRVQVAINAGIAPAGLASARWRRRAILLTTPHASLRVLQRTPLEVWASSNPVDVGWCAARTGAVRGGGNSQSDVTGWDRKVTVKVYGVAVTMPQGQSGVPISSTGRQ